MSRTRLGLALLGLLSLLLLATAPARLMAYLLPAEQLRLQGFSGSLWQGRAGSAAVAVGDGWLQLGQLRWDMSLLSLLILSPRIDLESRWGQQTLSADISLSPTGSLRFRDSSASFDARLVRQLLPVQLRGALSVLFNDLRVRDRVPTAGAGRLVWQGAHWIGNSGNQPLGDYLVEFEVVAEGQLAGTVSTLSGPIRAEGSFALEGRSYSIDVRLTSERGFDSELASALTLMAAPVEGGYQVKFSSDF